MSAKKLGKATLDIEKQLWGMPDKVEKFYMDKRLIDGHPEAKAYRSRNAHFLRSSTPTRRKINKREEYFKIREEVQKEWAEVLTRIFDEIRAESENYPLPLRRYRDYDHNNDMRYCLFRGKIYKFDRPNYSITEMAEQIEALEMPAEEKRK